MNIVPLIIQAVGGALGANLTGKILPRIDQGVIINSIAGIVGGGLGGQIWNMLGIAAMPSGSFDIVSIIGNIAAGGVGGGILMAIVGLVLHLFRR